MVVTIVLIALILLVSVIFIAKSHKKDSPKNNSNKTPKEYICYHTALDCENCLNSTRCGQQNGRGYVGVRHMGG